MWYTYFSLVLLLIRPGSASPSGKPSGPGGPVGPLPTHFAPQVSILFLFVCWDVLKDLCLLPFSFEHLKVCHDVKAAVQKCTAPLYFLLNMQNVMKEASSRAFILGSNYPDQIQNWHANILSVHLFPSISSAPHRPSLPLSYPSPPVTNRSPLLRVAWWCTCGPPLQALSPTPSRDPSCRSTSLSSSAPPLTPTLAVTLPTPPLPLPPSPMLKGQMMAWRWATHCKYR